MRALVAWLVAWIALALGCVGCSSTEFDPPELIEKDRPLAGRVFVTSDEGRATPAPGERASYELLVVSPGPQVPWTYLLAVCRFGRDRDNIGTCDPNLPLVAQSALDAPPVVPPNGLPSISFQVPDATTLGADEDELLVEGLICPGGPFDSGLLEVLATGELGRALAFPNPCADKTKNGLILSSPFRIERSPIDRNLSPQIAGVSWSQLAMKPPIATGTAWTSRADASAPATGCQGRGFTELTAQKAPIGVQIELAPGAREAYQQRSPLSAEKLTAATEVPSLFGYASAGEFVIVRDNQQADGQILQLTWRPPPPDEIDPAGTLVRFWLLVGDHRDVNRNAEAVSWVDRALCLIR